MTNKPGLTSATGCPTTGTMKDPTMGTPAVGVVMLTVVVDAAVDVAVTTIAPSMPWTGTKSTAKTVKRMIESPANSLVETVDPRTDVVLDMAPIRNDQTFIA